jgi:hypothetical protein
MDEFFKPVTYFETFYNDKGKECLDDEKCFAKTVSKKSDQIDVLSHYVLFRMNNMIDPWGNDCSRRKLDECSFKKVSPECLKSYIKYLKTRDIRFLVIAQRKQNG